MRRLPFMSFAVVPVELLGGLSLTPAPVLGALLVLRTALAGRGARVVLTDALLPRRDAAAHALLARWRW